MTTHTPPPHDIRHGVPCGSHHPAWYYLMAYNTFLSEEPTEVEWRMMRSYIEFLCIGGGYFAIGSPVGKRCLEEKNMVQGGHNTLVLHKRGDDDWGYRRISFDRGPEFAPQPDSGHGVRFSLFDLLNFLQSADRDLGTIYEPTGKWADWVAAHPEVFDVH